MRDRMCDRSIRAVRQVRFLLADSREHALSALLSPLTLLILLLAEPARITMCSIAYAGSLLTLCVPPYTGKARGPTGADKRPGIVGRPTRRERSPDVAVDRHDVRLLVL